LTTPAAALPANSVSRVPKRHISTHGTTSDRVRRVAFEPFENFSLNHYQITFNKTVLTMNFKPINDRVVVKPAPAEEKTKGGIIIPDTAKEKPQKGEVVAVGPGKDDIKMTVKTGDVVLYGKYAGQEMSLDGTDYLIMREDDILVILG
jgi:chaperonin GroES